MSSGSAPHLHAKLQDPHSYANLTAFSTFHIDIEWFVDFETKSISGSVKLLIAHASTDAAKYARTLMLDAKKLTISRIVDSEANQLLFKEERRQFGSCIQIELSEACLATPTFSIEISYATASGEAATGLQWLTASQTADGAAPFVYSQCQAIHARTLLPCQDSPAVKQTLSAAIRTSRSDVVVLMGALPVTLEEKEEVANGANQSRVFRFRQPMPIPAYLLAVCVGRLEAREIGDRCVIYAEPSVLARAAAEFDDVESFLQHAEVFFGLPYQWTRYACVVLPPSFPYGGMENACLTFVTPTLVAGDKSLVSVLIHEIVHSWTGNLLTNCSWEHFWLNEGFTKFIERKIVGAVYGEKFRHLASAVGYSLLKEAVAFLGCDAETTKLQPCMLNVDPDEAFSRIPYEKGSLFLWHLEQLVGGARPFDAFLRAYVAEFGAGVANGGSAAAIKSVLHTDDFRAAFERHFADVVVDWETWLRAPGMPPFEPQFSDEGAMAECLSLADAWLVADAAASTDSDGSLFAGLHPLQKVLFLDALLQKAPVAHAILDAMDKRYRFFDRSRNVSAYNVEIALKWIMIGVTSKYQPIVEHATYFVGSVGRMQYIRPLYRALFKWLPQVAWDLLYANEAFYHPIAKRIVMNELSIAASHPSHAP